MALLGILIALVVPAWLFNQWLLRVLQPRAAFRRFLLYVAISLASAFVYTFIFVWLIGHFFPPARH